MNDSTARAVLRSYIEMLRLLMSQGPSLEDLVEIIDWSDYLASMASVQPRSERSGDAMGIEIRGECH